MARVRHQERRRLVRIGGGEERRPERLRAILRISAVAGAEAKVVGPEHDVDGAGVAGRRREGGGDGDELADAVCGACVVGGVEHCTC